MSVCGCKALLTGAGGGIGRAIAVALAKEGVKTVLFGGKREEMLEKTANLIKQNGGECVVVSGDLTDDKFLSAGYEKAISELGGFYFKFFSAKFPNCEDSMLCYIVKLFRCGKLR